MEESVIVEGSSARGGRADAEAVFAAVDRQDAAAFAGAFDPDGVFVFGNAAPVAGPAAIEAAVSNFFRILDGLRHELHDVWEAGDAVISRLTVTYIRLDGTTVTLPAATIWHGQYGAITDYRIYADLGPLLTPAA